MNKKIIIAVALLALVVGVFAACKGNEEKPKEKPTGMEITTDDEGNAFVVNTDGDLIPFTTDKDGYFPLPDELFTKSYSEFVSESEAASKAEGENNSDIVIPTKNETEKPTGGKPAKPTKPESSTRKPISVDKQGGDAVIDWNDIKPR